MAKPQVSSQQHSAYLYGAAALNHEMLHAAATAGFGTANFIFTPVQKFNVDVEIAKEIAREKTAQLQNTANQHAANTNPVAQSEGHQAPAQSTGEDENTATSHHMPYLAQNNVDAPSLAEASSVQNNDAINTTADRRDSNGADISTFTKAAAENNQSLSSMVSSTTTLLNTDALQLSSPEPVLANGSSILAPVFFFDPPNYIALGDTLDLRPMRFGAFANLETGVNNFYAQLASNLQNIIGGQYGDTLVGQGDGHFIYGGVGNDYIYVTAISGTYYGGGGTNVMDYSMETTPVNMWFNTAVGGTDSLGDAFKSFQVVVGAIAGNSTFYMYGNYPITITAQGTNNTVDFSNITSQSVNVNLITNVNSGGAAGDVFYNMSTVVGSANGGDHFVGTSNVTFVVNAGNNVIEGGAISYARMSDGGNGHGGVTVQMGATTGSDTLGDTLTNVHGFIGNGSGQNELDYSNIASPLTINTVSGTDSQGDTFSQFQNFVGAGTGNTVFLAADSNQTFTGNGTNNTLSYQAAGAAITVSLVAETASGAGFNSTFSDISNVMGSLNGGDVITGDANDNTITEFTGTNVVIGGGGNDTVYTGSGNDTVTQNNGGSLNVIVNAAGNTGTDVFTGVSGQTNRLNLSQLNNAFTLTLNDSATTPDTVTGNTVNESLINFRTYNASNANNTLSYANIASSGVTVNLLTMAQAAAGTYQDSLGYTLSGYFSTVIGSADNDTITGYSNNNLYGGSGGNDTIYGGTGSNYLYGSTTGLGTIYTSANTTNHVYGGTSGVLYAYGNTGTNYYYGGGGWTAGALNTLNLSALAKTFTLHLDTGTLTATGVTDTFGNLQQFTFGNTGFNTVYAQAATTGITVNGGAGGLSVYGNVDNNTYNGNASGANKIDYTNVNSAGSLTLSLSNASGINAGMVTNVAGTLNNTLTNFQTIIGNGQNDTVVINQYNSNSFISFNVSNIGATPTLSYGNTDGVTVTLNANNSFNSDSFNDHITGTISTLYGSAGDDTITGGNNNTLYGGSGGNDTLYAGTGTNTIYGSATGNGTVYTTANTTNNVYGGVLNGTVNGTIYAYGNTGTNYYQGGNSWTPTTLNTVDMSNLAGPFILHLDTDTLTGANVTDTFSNLQQFTFGNTGLNTVYAQAGTSSITVNGGAGGLNVNGNADNNNYYGNAAAGIAGLNTLTYGNITNLITSPLTFTLNNLGTPSLSAFENISNTAIGLNNNLLNFQSFTGTGLGDIFKIDSAFSTTAGSTGYLLNAGTVSGSGTPAGATLDYSGMATGVNVNISGMNLSSAYYSTPTGVVSAPSLDSNYDSLGDSFTGTFTTVIGSSQGTHNFIYGNNLNDTIYGGGASGVTIIKGTGNNSIYGSSVNGLVSGSITIVGNTGTNFFYGSTDLDQSGVTIADALDYHLSNGALTINMAMNGGSAVGTLAGINDTFTYFTVLYGTDYGDTIKTDNTDTIYAGTGNNVITGQGGAGTGSNNVLIYGGGNSDNITVGKNSTVYADTASTVNANTVGLGNQTTINAIGNNNSIYGGGGANTITLSGSHNLVEGGGGRNIITDTGSNNTIYGSTQAGIAAGVGGSVGSGNNSTQVGVTNDNQNIIYGASGDTIYGGSGVNYLYASGITTPGAALVYDPNNPASLIGAGYDPTSPIATLYGGVSGVNGTGVGALSTSTQQFVVGAPSTAGGTDAAGAVGGGNVTMYAETSGHAYFYGGTGFNIYYGGTGRNDVTGHGGADLFYGSSDTSIDTLTAGNHAFSQNNLTFTTDAATNMLTSMSTTAVGSYSAYTIQASDLQSLNQAALQAAWAIGALPTIFEAGSANNTLTGNLLDNNFFSAGLAGIGSQTIYGGNYSNIVITGDATGSGDAFYLNGGLSNTGTSTYADYVYATNGSHLIQMASGANVLNLQTANVLGTDSLGDSYLTNTSTMNHNQETITAGNGNNTVAIAGSVSGSLSLGNGANNVRFTPGSDSSNTAAVLMTVTLGTGSNTVTADYGTDTTVGLQIITSDIVGATNTITLTDQGSGTSQGSNFGNTVTAGNGTNIITLNADQSITQAVNTITAGNGNNVIALNGATSDNITLGTGNNTIQFNAGALGATAVVNATIQLGSGSNTVSSDSNANPIANHNFASDFGADTNLNITVTTADVAGSTNNITLNDQGTHTVNVNNGTDNIYVSGNNNITFNNATTHVVIDNSATTNAVNTLSGGNANNTLTFIGSATDGTSSTPMGLGNGNNTVYFEAGSLGASADVTAYLSFGHGSNTVYSGDLASPDAPGVTASFGADTNINLTLNFDELSTATNNITLADLGTHTITTGAGTDNIYAGGNNLVEFDSSTQTDTFDGHLYTTANNIVYGGRGNLTLKGTASATGSDFFYAGASSSGYTHTLYHYAGINGVYQGGGSMGSGSNNILSYINTSSAVTISLSSAAYSITDAGALFGLTATTTTGAGAQQDSFGNIIANIQTIDGSAYADRITANGNQTINGGNYVGGTGGLYVELGANGNGNTIHAGTGGDKLYAVGGSNNVFYGGAGADFLYGGGTVGTGSSGGDNTSGANTFFGGAGDTLIGDFDTAITNTFYNTTSTTLATGSNDYFYGGGTTSNQYWIGGNNAQNIFNTTGTPVTITGGSGASAVNTVNITSLGGITFTGGTSATNLLNYSALTAGVTVNSSAYSPTAYLPVTAGKDSLGDTLSNVTSILGTAYNDTFVVGSGQTVHGNGGSDTFYISGGATTNDVLYGDNGTATFLVAGSDNNTFYGGSGSTNNTLSFANYTGGETFFADLSTGTDSFGDTFSNIQILYGSPLNDTLTIGNGQTVYGGGGSDTIYTAGNGSSGTPNTYNVNANNSSITLLGSWENVALSGTTGSQVFSDANTQTVTNSGGNNAFYAGSETNFVVYGSTNDSMYGGTADPNYFYSGGGTPTTGRNTFYANSTAETWYGGASETNNYYAGASTNIAIVGHANATDNLYSSGGSVQYTGSGFGSNTALNVYGSGTVHADFTNANITYNDNTTGGSESVSVTGGSSAGFTYNSSSTNGSNFTYTQSGSLASEAAFNLNLSSGVVQSLNVSNASVAININNASASSLYELYNTNGANIYLSSAISSLVGSSATYSVTGSSGDYFLTVSGSLHSYTIAEIQTSSSPNVSWG